MKATTLNRVQAMMHKSRTAYYISTALAISAIFALVILGIFSIHWLYEAYQAITARLLSVMGFTAALSLGLFGLGLAIWNGVTLINDKYKPPFVVTLTVGIFATLCAMVGSEGMELRDTAHSIGAFLGSYLLPLFTGGIAVLAVSAAFRERFLVIRK